MKPIIALLALASLAHAGEQKVEQKVAVINTCRTSYIADGEKSINQLLREGWIVKSSTANKDAIMVVFERAAQIPTE